MRCCVSRALTPLLATDPGSGVSVARTFAGQVGQISAMDVILGIAEVLPSGLYSSSGIERYVRTVLSDPDRADDFRLLENELYLAATDLDTCERIVFGANDWDDVPISTAVGASTATSRLVVETMPPSTSSRSRILTGL